MGEERICETNTTLKGVESFLPLPFRESYIVSSPGRGVGSGDETKGEPQDKIVCEQFLLIQHFEMYAMMQISLYRSLTHSTQTYPKIIYSRGTYI